MNELEKIVRKILPEYSDIKIKATEEYIGVWKEKKIIFKIIPRRDFYRLEIKHFDTEQNAIRQNQWDVHKFKNMEELRFYKDEIIHLIKHISNMYDDEPFSCCSLFVACSDALKCVNPHANIKRNCRYRKKLENGIIYYGSNRNI